MEELKCIKQLSDLAEQVDAPGFRYELYKYPEDFGFSTPICIEKGLKSLFKNYPSPQSEELHPLKDLIDHFDTHRNPGEHSVQWLPNNLPGGIYFISLDNPIIGRPFQSKFRTSLN